MQCAQCFCESALSPEELGQGSDDDDYGFNETSTDIVNASSTETQVSAYLTGMVWYSRVTVEQLLKGPLSEMTYTVSSGTLNSSRRCDSLRLLATIIQIQIDRCQCWTSIQL